MEIQKDNFEEITARIAKIGNWIEQLKRENAEKDLKIKELELKLAKK